jgi:hypothetical protein
VLSFLCAFGTLAAGLAVLGRDLLHAWRAIVLARASARAEAAALDDLRPGPATIIGVVETDGVADAIVVDIVERGSEAEGSDGGWSHTWHEVERRVRARPFWLVRKDGERVRVEPGGAPAIIDDLVLVERTSPDRRLRAAHVEAGEAVRASGVLRREPLDDPRRDASGYRGGAVGWMLRPRGGLPMLVSTRPLVAVYRRAAFFRLAAAVVAAAALLAVQNVLGSIYYPLLFHGEATVGLVTALEPYTYVTTDDDGHTHRHHAVHVVLEVHGHEVRPPMEHTVAGRLRLGDRVAVVALADASIVQLGDEASVSMPAAILACILIAPSGTLYAAIARRRRRWWEGKRLVTSGAGQLAAPDAPRGDEPG